MASGTGEALASVGGDGGGEGGGDSSPHPTMAKERRVARRRRVSIFISVVVGQRGESKSKCFRSR